MKKKFESTSGFTVLPPSKVYLDDIEEVVRMLEESGAKVSVETGQYELNSWEELEELETKRLDDLEIDFATEEDRPWGNIRLDRHYGMLIFIKSDAVSAGMKAYIMELFRKRQRSLVVRGMVGFSWQVLVLLLLVILANAIAATTLWGIETGKAIGQLGGVLLIGIYFAASLRLRHNVIILRRRNERTSFIERNWEALLVNAIVAALSIALTVLATKMFGASQ